MKKVVIEGVTYPLSDRDHVSYGAEKELERAQFAASLAMLSEEDVRELATQAKTSAEGKPDIDEKEFMDRVLSGEIKDALLDSHDAAITPEEEAIILSVGLSRKEMLKLPGKVVRKLAKAAMEELGEPADFSEASTTVTS